MSIKIFIFIIIGLFCLSNLAHSQAEINVEPLASPIVYKSIPKMVKLGQEIYSEGFEDGLSCMALMFLKYKYGEPIRLIKQIG